MFGHDTSIVSEDNFELVFGGLHEGVLAGVDDECRVNATAPTTAQVRVEIGTFVTGGVFARVSAAELLTIPANVAGNPRIDRIICQRDNATNTVTVEVLQGTPAGAPVPPTLTRAAGVYEISLAQIYVANGFVTITNDDIRDERDNPNLCGFSSGKAFQQQARNRITGFQQQMGGWTAWGGSTTVRALGLGSANTVDNASAAVTDADGVGLQQDTSAVLNNDAYIDDAGQNAYRRDQFTVAEFKVKLLDNTAIRMFIGLSDAGAGAMNGADDPAGNYIGLQFSTARPDTNWQFVAKDGAVQDIVDSGIAVDTDAHFVRISCALDGSGITIELFDTDHTILASAVFLAADNIPPAATWLKAHSAIRTLAVAVKSIVQYHLHTVNRKN